MRNLIRRAVGSMRVGRRKPRQRRREADRKTIEIGMCSLRGCERPTFNKDVCEIHFDPRQRETA